MKKTRIIALALSAAIMVMGAGYAALTETVTINNTVSTTALDVETVTPTVTVYSAPGIQDTTVASVKSATVSNPANADSSATIEVEKLYPGAIIDVKVPIKNVGDIPVKLDNAGTAAAVLSDANFEVVDINVPAVTKLEKDQTSDITYKILVKDGAAENSALTTFTFQPVYEQFNQ